MKQRLLMALDIGQIVLGGFMVIVAMVTLCSGQVVAGGFFFFLLTGVLLYRGISGLKKRSRKPAV